MSGIDHGVPETERDTLRAKLDAALELHRRGDTGLPTADYDGHVSRCACCLYDDPCATSIAERVES